MNRRERRRKKSKRELKLEHRMKYMETIKSLEDDKVYTISDEMIGASYTLPGYQIKHIYNIS